MRKFAQKLLLVLFSAFFGLAICEIGLRLLGYKYSGSTWTLDPVVGVGLRPGASAWEVDEGLAWTKINSHGYRDRDRALSKPPGVYRIAALGDSYTEARQVPMDKTFTSLAEDELNRNHSLGERQVEVLNFGIGGIGTAQELIQLRERVWKFDPDMIVLQFYAGNDLFNNYRALNVSPPDKAPYFLLKNGKLELDDSFRQVPAYNHTYIRLKGIGADIINRFVLLQLVYKLRNAHAQQGELARLNGGGQNKTQSDPNAPPPEYQRFLSFLPPTIPSMVEAWEVTEAVIAEIGKEVKSHHAPLLVMIMPTDIQINPDPEKQGAYRAKYHIESLEYADDRVEHLAREHGFPVLRLTRPLVEEARRTGTYMAGFANTGPNDGHLNERGHAVVARELVRAACEIASGRATASAVEH